MQGCDLCGGECKKDEAKWLPLYVIGSEGVTVCLPCRIALTEVAKGIRSASFRARKQGYLFERSRLVENQSRESRV